MRNTWQRTLANDVFLEGIGAHSGGPSSLRLSPAPADTGILLVSSANARYDRREIPAGVEAVVATELATVVGNAAGPMFSTAEHALAALQGLEIDNAVIEVDGPETPILDGSSKPIVEAIDRAGGTCPQNVARRYIEVLKPLTVRFGNAVGTLSPHPQGFSIRTDVDFDHPAIGAQSFEAHLTPETFRTEIAPARTFGFIRDVTRLWSAGYALGSSFENTLVFSEDRLLNPEGLRFANEPARHKALDIVGDFALAGAPLLAAYHSVHGGHKLNYAVLRALMSDKTAWRFSPGASLHLVS